MNCVKTLVLLSLSAILLSCQSKISIQIDNPTDRTVSLQLNEQEIKLEPQTTLIYLASAGRNKMTLENGQTESFILNFKKNILLNPTQSRYVMESVAYMTEQMKEHGPFQSKNKISVGGYSIEGPYWLNNGDLIIETWDYGPSEAPPKSLEVNIKYSAGYEQREKVKVHRETDFVDILEAQYRGTIRKYIKEGIDRDVIRILLEMSEEQFKRLE